jgi:hypothetical protein
LSIDDVSFRSVFDNSVSTELASVAPITAVTFSLDGNTSGDSRDTPHQKAQTPEDDPGAKTEPEGFDADLKAQIAPTSSGEIGNDLTSLLQDLTSGNTSAAKADVSRVRANLQSQDASSVAGAQAGGPLDTLIAKISDSLNSDSAQDTPQDGAQRDLANFLVENEQGTGSLINTSA